LVRGHATDPYAKRGRFYQHERIYFMRKSTFVVAALALLALIVYIGCNIRRQQPQTQTTPALQKIRVAQFGDLLLYLPLYIAKHEQVFKRHGLDVEIVSTGGDDKTFAAVLSGDVQFGVADPVFVAVAAERGERGVVVGMLIDGVPNYGVALSKALPTIRDPKELTARTVATVPAPSTSYALVARLYQSAGVKPRIYQVSAPGLVPALKSGAADYALLIEPWVSEVLEDGGKIGFSLMDYYKHFALTGITTSRSVITTDSSVTTRFLAALTESVHIFYDDESATLKTAEERFPGTPERVLRDAITRLRRDAIYPKCLTVRQESWQASIDLRREIGDLTRPPKEMAYYVDNRFAQENCK